MPLPRPVTTHDIERIAMETHTAPDPVGLAMDLVAAATHGGLANPGEDTGFALQLAAELLQAHGDLDAAEQVARQAADTDSVDDKAYIISYHGELLLRLGREKEGLERISELKPLIWSQPIVACHVSDALVEAGYRETAEEWLAGMAAEALGRRNALKSEGGLEYERAVALSRDLLTVLHNLGFPDQNHDK
ncbi:MAG: hypothetical protein HOQ24_06325 [Mycobacteriaceae bacterium]|nr:hypothetical protein [Mycobacteriaceae bacterium]